MLENKDFILSSIDSILEESVSVSKLSCMGIETYPLQEYILQSTFLKMTGYSEQKLKCICWDIASVDYDFRYQVYQNWTFSECSNLSDKTKIFRKIVEKIKDYDNTFNVENYISDLYDEPKKIIKNNYEKCKCILDSSAIKYFHERAFNTFINDTETFKTNQEICKYTSKKSFILNDNLKEIYEELYKQRNRCAHNLKSYQQNLPKITVLLKNKNTSNYFYYFTLLMLMDEIFIRLYAKLSNLILENNW